MPDTAQPFEVHSYDIAALRRIMAEEAGASQHLIDGKLHLEYFQSYFEHLNSLTIVVEHDYVDRDYLEDYAAYYVRCFHGYDRRCTRLHFFSHSFVGDDFSRLLRGSSETLTQKMLSDSYLGFIVIKPLPQTVVGRTCLRCYEPDGGRRYPITRNYEVNLFGLELTVKNTLAFQEQDSVVAACATSALWSVFHGTGKQFQHAIPSPVEITRAAASCLLSPSRALPNHGLFPEQMAQAIRAVGLEPFFEGVGDESLLKNVLYAYLSGHVPVIMGVHLVDISATPPVLMGAHAVAVTGFRSSTTPGPCSLGGFRSKACGIDRIYAHDDGVGPFARMKLDGVKVQHAVDGTSKEVLSLSTSWRTSKGTPDSVRAVPVYLLIPLYHKIRIPYSSIQNMVVQFDEVLEILRAAGVLPIPEQLEWDLYLTTVNQFKKSIFSCSALPEDDRARVLSMPLPRFLWRANATCQESSILDILFDATDIEQGQCFLYAVKYDQPFAQVLQAIVDDSNAVTTLGHLPAWTILKQFCSDGPVPAVT